MQKRITLIRIVIAIITLSSCAPAYIPTSVEVPVFKEEGEVNISVQTGTAGIDPHLSVAITNNVAIMLNGSFGESDEVSNDPDDIDDRYHKHMTGEMGLGYYENFGKHGFCQVFAGYGYGRVKSYYAWEVDGFVDYFTTADMQKVFVQPSVGFTSNYFEIAFTPRFTHLNINVNHRKYNDLFVEPVITMKVGSPTFKVTAQGGLAFPTEVLNYDYRPFIFNVGFSLMLGRKMGEE